jgi:hypothetical protein
MPPPAAPQSFQPVPSSPKRGLATLRHCSCCALRRCKSIWTCRAVQHAGKPGRNFAQLPRPCTRSASKRTGGDWALWRPSLMPIACCSIVDTSNHMPRAKISARRCWPRYLRRPMPRHCQFGSARCGAANQMTFMSGMVSKGSNKRSSITTTFVQAAKLSVVSSDTNFPSAAPQLSTATGR